MLKVYDSEPLLSQVLTIYLCGGNISVEFKPAQCALQTTLKRSGDSLLIGILSFSSK